MNYPRSFFLAVSAVLLLGCQSAPRTRAVASAAQPLPAAAVAQTKAYLPDDNLNAVVWQQTSEEYRLIASQTYRAASQQLDRAMKDRTWDALTREDRDRPAAGLPPAVIVDVDETVLDNSAYQARLVRDHLAYDEFTWHNWAEEQAAKAVPGALEFALAAASKGITVYYVSNRAQDLEQATVDNLRKLGFPIANPGQFLGLGTILDGCEDNGSEKGCRRRLVGRSHRVLVQVGDQIVDMVTVLANTPEGRHLAVEPYLDWIGERWFVLPNVTYGSWEPALFNNDWTQPADDRRQQKLEALRY